jgi:hypothetical protein
MALLYPWATKEYLLWEMSIGQIIMYYNLGMQMKYGEDEQDEKTGSCFKSADDVLKVKNEMIKTGLIKKYGDIDG